MCITIRVCSDREDSRIEGKQIYINKTNIKTILCMVPRPSAKVVLKARKSGNLLFRVIDISLLQCYIARSVQRKPLYQLRLHYNSGIMMRSL